jgi:hypothetical protein
LHDFQSLSEFNPQSIQTDFSMLFIKAQSNAPLPALCQRADLHSLTKYNQKVFHPSPKDENCGHGKTLAATG